MALTQKQQRFIDEYLIDLNATQAAIRAGYSEKTAYSIGFENLRKPELEQAISERFQELQLDSKLTIEKVINELEKLAFARIDTYVQWGPQGVTLKASEDLPEGASSAVQEVSENVTEKGRNVRFKLHDKSASLDKLLKYLQWRNEYEDLRKRVEALKASMEGQLC